MCVQGLNWGLYKLEEDSFQLFHHQTKKKILQFDYSEISLSNASGKNEVALEFQQPEPVKGQDGQLQKPKGDFLCEMRFYVQNNEIQNRGPDQQLNDDEDPDEITAAKCFNDKLVAKAGLGDQKGEIIASFEELPMMIPRGKYTLDMYEDFGKFHGRTYDYKIMYKDVKKVFQLPRVDLQQMAIVIQLIKPLKQGQTLHHFIMIQVDKDAVQRIKINLTPEQIKDKYDGNFEQEIEGPLYHVLATLFKNIVDVERIIIPGDFRSA